MGFGAPVYVDGVGGFGAPVDVDGVGREGEDCFIRRSEREILPRRRCACGRFQAVQLAQDEQAAPVIHDGNSGTTARACLRHHLHVHPLPPIPHLVSILEARRPTGRCSTDGCSRCLGHVGGGELRGQGRRSGDERGDSGLRSLLRVASVEVRFDFDDRQNFCVCAWYSGGTGHERSEDGSSTFIWPFTIIDCRTHSPSL